MPLVLIIEDDPSTRMLHAKALADMQGYTVVTAGTLTDARAMLATSTPDLVLLDLRLPDGTGLDVLQLLERQPTRADVLIVSSFTEDVPAGVASAAPLTILDKPVPPEELRCRVLEALQLQRGASEFTVPEYLQMACIGKHSVLLTVTSARRAGFVAVRHGEIWAAAFGPQRGFEAFYTLTALSDCAIEVRPWPDHEVPRELAGSYEELLLEAARRQDEAGREGAPFLPDEELDFSDLLDGLEGPANCNSDVAPTVADLVAQGVQAVIARDYGQAVALLRRAESLDPGNAAIRHRLERLYRLGFGDAGCA